MHNKCSNKTEINCNAKQCFYEDYWKFMTRVHHDMTHNAWAMSIGELRTLKDEIIVLHNKAVDLVNANECYDETKTKERKYFMWVYDAELNLSILYDYVVEWIDILDKIYNNLNVFIESNECPFLESLTGKKAMGVTSKNFKI